MEFWSRLAVRCNAPHRCKNALTVPIGALCEWLAERGTQALIPPRRTPKTQYAYDPTIYKQCNIIEGMFCSM